MHACMHAKYAHDAGAASQGIQGGGAPLAGGLGRSAPQCEAEALVSTVPLVHLQWYLYQEIYILNIYSIEFEIYIYI